MVLQGVIYWNYILVGVVTSWRLSDNLTVIAYRYANV